MLQTIEVQIDDNGVVHPLELDIKLPKGKALLTLLNEAKPLPITKSDTKNNFDDLFGIIKTDKTASIEDMERAIYQRVMERFNDCD